MTYDPSVEPSVHGSIRGAHHQAPHVPEVPHVEEEMPPPVVQNPALVGDRTPARRSPRSNLTSSIASGTNGKDQLLESSGEEAAHQVLPHLSTIPET